MCTHSPSIRFTHLCPVPALIPLQDPVPSGFSSSDVLIPLADEYDPMFPNDYEKVMKRHREERQRQREQERQKEIEEREKCARTPNLTHSEEYNTNDLLTHRPCSGAEMFPEDPVGKAPI